MQNNHVIINLNFPGLSAGEVSVCEYRKEFVAKEQHCATAANKQIAN